MNTRLFIIAKTARNSKKIIKDRELFILANNIFKFFQRNIRHKREKRGDLTSILKKKDQCFLRCPRFFLLSFTEIIKDLMQALKYIDRFYERFPPSPYRISSVVH